MLKFTWLFLTILFLTILLPDRGYPDGLVPEFIPEKAPEKIRIKYPEVLVWSDTGAVNYFLIVEKKTQTILVYQYQDGYKLLHTLKCTTGKNAGPKALEGDRKTPEGVYFFIHKYHKKELAPIYGAGAFPTDYPNLLDTLAGRNGTAIWLHGTNKTLKPRDSNGCIALKNSDFRLVSKYISLNRTPMIITKDLSYAPLDQNLQADVLQILTAWQQALSYGTYHQYLSFYSSEYLPDIDWWSQRSKSNSVAIKIKDLLVFKTNIANKTTITAYFNEVMHRGPKKIIVGTRKLFFNKNLKIIGDQYQLVAKTLKKDQKHPFIAASLYLQHPSTLKSKIITMIDNWIKAWESKDILSYGDYYSDDFKSQNMNKKEWLKLKNRLNNVYSYIRVKRGEIVTKQYKNSIIVEFIQHYDSPGLKASGNKRLTLKLEGGKWKIYRETWQKI